VARIENAKKRFYTRGYNNLPNVVLGKTATGGIFTGKNCHTPVGDASPSSVLDPPLTRQTRDQFN